MDRLMAAPTRRGNKGCPRVSHNPLKRSMGIAITATRSFLIALFNRRAESSSSDKLLSRRCPLRSWARLYRYTRAVNSPAINRREQRAKSLGERTPVANVYAKRNSKAKKQRHRKRKLFRIDFEGDEGGCKVVHLLSKYPYYTPRVRLPAESGTDMAGAVCTFSTFKPKNLVLPCLISRCKEKSYVLPLVETGMAANQTRGRLSVIQAKDYSYLNRPIRPHFSSVLRVCSWDRTLRRRLSRRSNRRQDFSSPRWRRYISKR